MCVCVIRCNINPLRTPNRWTEVKIIIVVVVIIIIIIIIMRENSIDSQQKTAVLGTSHIIRKVLQCEA